MEPATAIPAARRRLNLVGWATWVVIVLALVLSLMRHPGQVSTPESRIALAGLAVFALALALSSRVPDASRFRPARIALLALQSLAAAAASVFVFGGAFAPGGILTVVIATQVAVHFPRRGWWWIAGQTLLLAAAYVATGWALQLAGLIALAFGAFQCFGFVAARTAEREAAARHELAAVNARLLDAQAQLAAAAATAERARIWRELHDVMGHHLAALSLNLEAAANLTQGRGQELVRHARAMSRLMLADIRSVLSEPEAATAAEPLDLPGQLAAVGRELLGVTIHTEIGELTPPPSAAAAHAMLRAAQECITNATVHGRARTIHLACRVEGEAYVLRVRDDGRGAHTITPGSGLTNMRRRFEELGGRVTWVSSSRGGFEVEGVIPRRAAAATSPDREAAT